MGRGKGLPPRRGAATGRQDRAGSERSLGPLVPGPFHPLRNRAERADLLAEPAPGQIIADLLGGDLQPEEGVDAGEVTAERGRARGVDHALTARRSAQFEGPLDIKPLVRIAAHARVVEQVLEHAVLSDVRLEAGGVDDVIGRDLQGAVRGPGDADDLVALDPHVVHGALHDAVPALAAPLVHLGLPAPTPGRVSAAHLLVPGEPGVAFELAHLGLELTAPDRLRVVETLISEAVAALALVPGAQGLLIRTVRALDE